MDTNVPRIDTGALLATEAATGFIENKTFDEITVGENAELTRTVTQSDIELFASISEPVWLDCGPNPSPAPQMLHLRTAGSGGSYALVNGRRSAKVI